MLFSCKHEKHRVTCHQVIHYKAVHVSPVKVHVLKFVHPSFLGDFGGFFVKSIHFYYAHSRIFSSQSRNMVSRRLQALP